MPPEFVISRGLSNFTDVLREIILRDCCNRWEVGRVQIMEIKLQNVLFYTVTNDKKKISNQKRGGFLFLKIEQKPGGIKSERRCIFHQLKVQCDKKK